MRDLGQIQLHVEYEDAGGMGIQDIRLIAMVRSCLTTSRSVTSVFREI